MAFDLVCFILGGGLLYIALNKAYWAKQARRRPGFVVVDKVNRAAFALIGVLSIAIGVWTLFG